MLYGDVWVGIVGGAAGEALRFVRDAAAGLADGRHELGDGMYAEIRQYRPAPAGEKRYESHARYIDVQCVLEGEEGIYVRPVAGLEVGEDLLRDRDVVFYRDPAPGGEEQLFVMTPGKFLLLPPEDAHKPECLTRFAEGRKVVCKIPVALLDPPAAT